MTTPADSRPPLTAAECADRLRALHAELMGAADSSHPAARFYYENVEQKGLLAAASHLDRLAAVERDVPFGLQLVLDESIPEGEAHFRMNGTTVSKITGLESRATPSGDRPHG